MHHHTLLLLLLLLLLLFLFIFRKIHSNDHIVESAALPNNLIRRAGGNIAFEESGVRVGMKVGRGLKYYLFPL